MSNAVSCVVLNWRAFTFSKVLASIWGVAGMLDEPTAGVSPIVMDELFDRIIEVARTGIPILMVEQNARQALSIADKGYVLVQGRNAFTGSGAELLNNPEVRKSFLGKAAPVRISAISRPWSTASLKWPMPCWTSWPSQ